MAKHDRASSPWPPKSAIVEAVAHLSLGVLERYALNKVSEREVQRFQEHVSTCSECKALLQREFVWATARRSPGLADTRKTVVAQRKKAAKR